MDIVDNDGLAKPFDTLGDKPEKGEQTPSAEELYNELKYNADELVKLGASGEKDYGLQQVGEDYSFVYKEIGGKRFYVCRIHDIPTQPYYSCQFFRNRVTMISANNHSARHDLITIRSRRPDRGYSTEDISSISASSGSSGFGQYISTIKGISDYWNRPPLSDTPSYWIRNDVPPRPRPTPAPVKAAGSSKT